jgi:hypothetical protein
MTGKPYIDLGWANGWAEDPEIVKACAKAGHKPRDANRDPTGHGLHNVTICDICRYIYHYDSSG